MSAAGRYRRAFERGKTHEVRLESADGARSVDDVPAKVSRPGAETLAGSAQSLEHYVLILAEALGEFGVPTDGDRVVIDARVYRIRLSDGFTRAEAGITLAYALEAHA